MPDTGAPWNIPYVAASDLIKDWPTDNQQQAEAIDAALDKVKGFGNIQRVVKTDQFSMTGATPTQVTDLSLNITPSTNTALIFVVAFVALGNEDGGGNMTCALFRSSTQIAQHPLPIAGNRQHGVPLTVIDNPATTSSTNYNVRIWSPAAVGTVYANWSGGGRISRSSLLVAEIIP